MFCPKCGNEQREGATFCSSCGSPIQSSVDAAPVAAPAADGSVATKNPQNRKPLVILLCVLIAAIIVLSIVLYNLFFSSYKIDEKRFPDPTLRQTISVRVDINGDGSISKDEAKAVTALEFENASSVQGLEIFPNLQELNCTGDSLISLDIDGCKQLKKVSAPSCTNLSSLKLGSNGELETLDIADCPVAEIDVRGASKLQGISCKDSVVIQNLDDTPLHEYWAVKEYQTTNTSARFTTIAKASYAANGNLAKLVIEEPAYGTDTYTYEYDAQGRLSKMKQTYASRFSSGSHDCVSVPEYNDAGLLTKVVSTYDSKDYASSSTAAEFEASYNSQGLPTKIASQAYQGGGYEDTFSYDANGSLTSIATNLSNPPLTTSVTSDASGNITSMTGSSGQYTISYDAAGRIQRVVYANQYNPFDQTFEYDAQGRLANVVRKDTTPSTTLRHGDDSVTSTAFEYDARGLLTKVTPVCPAASEYTPSYTISYTRLLIASDKGPSSNFLNLANPLSPQVRGTFWIPDTYTEEGMLCWLGSMKNALAHASFN